MQEWAESEEGVGLPLSCVMDVLANVYNTDAPALLDCARRGLVPLIRQGRRGPAIDIDALLLVLVNEFADGKQRTASAHNAASNGCCSCCETCSAVESF